MSVNGERSDESPQRLDRVLKMVASAIPDAEVTDAAASRRFTRQEKNRILQEADQCKHGEMGALCRREGIYNSTLSKWRKQREEALREWEECRKPGPKPAEPNALEGRVAQLERENARLQQRLKQAETIIEVQKKISEILAIPLTSPASENND
jgi:transposase